MDWEDFTSHSIHGTGMTWYIYLYFDMKGNTHRKRGYSNLFLQPVSFHFVIDRALRSYYKAHLFAPPKKNMHHYLTHNMFSSTFKNRSLPATGIQFRGSYDLTARVEDTCIMASQSTPRRNKGVIAGLAKGNQLLISPYYGLIPGGVRYGGGLVD